MNGSPAEVCPVSPFVVAGAAASTITDTWERLARPTDSSERFDPAITEPLPEPARRWLRHVIAPGAPLARTVIVEMQGHIRLGRWVPFRAVQLHAPPTAYIWAARARLGPLWVAGYDRYSDVTGEMRWRLLSRIPVMSGVGPNYDRSAAGRVALDALLVPTAWLQPAVTWRAGNDRDTVIAEWHVDSWVLPVTLGVAPDGALNWATMPRWTNPGNRPWAEYPCGGALEGEATFNGITLGRKMRAGYFYGTDDRDSPASEFFRSEIIMAKFL